MGFSLGCWGIDLFQTDFDFAVRETAGRRRKDLYFLKCLKSCLQTLSGRLELLLRIQKSDQNLKSPELVSASCLAVAVAIHSDFAVVTVVVAAVVTQFLQIHEDLFPP